MNNQVTQLINNEARIAALEIYEQQQVVPTSLVEYQSSGNLIIITKQENIDFSTGLSNKFNTTILLLDGKQNSQKNIISTQGKTININGYMGAFSVSIIAPESKEASIVNLKSDLILDMSPDSIIDLIMPPNGYFASRTDTESLSQTKAKLENMVGTFQKPKFIDYSADICAHSFAGKTACSKCLDVCPAQAISSIAQVLTFAPFLCQGGGACATVCPTGAMKYAYPRMEDLIKNIQILITSYIEHGGKQPIIAFFADADGGEIELPEQSNILCVSIEELASTGLEVWLSLLAYGASGVLLVNRGSTPTQMLNEIEKQILLSTEILEALGYPSQAVALIEEAELQQSVEGNMPDISHATYVASSKKRETAFLAIDHLYKYAQRPNDRVNFSSPAPFGTAFVEDKCTLCFACVEACPGDALQTGEGIPQLHFIEANCVQCDMCIITCPENAISIRPRMLFEREQRQQDRILFEESPFNCISCGKPFATHSVIEKMLAKLSDHWMFKTERARNRLKMCDDCRIVDMVQDDAAMNAEKEQLLH